MTRVTTTCPQCATIFRVNPEQLAARRGQVRCGRCRHVFNGYETVSVGPDLPEGENGPAGSGDDTGAGLFSWWRRRQAARRRPTVAAPVTSSPAQPMARAEGLTKMVELVRGGPNPDRIEPGALRIRPAFGIEHERALDDFSSPAARMRRRVLRIGAAALVVLFPLLLVLGRASIIQWFPSVRGVYAAACRPLHCAVPLPADPEAWSVESSDLQVDTGTSQLFHFTATLRNRSGYPQAFPSLDLSLTDAEGLAVDRRVVPPAQYLPPFRPPMDGLGANSEISIRADVRGADQRSKGYRLVLFFP